jgi:DNA-binding NtrC family response regulator
VKAVTTKKYEEVAILVVVYEPIVRDLLSRALRSKGYKVLTSSVGSDGVKKFKKRKGKFDFAVIDTHLPDIGGLDMAKKIKGINGKMPVALIKGRGKNLHPRELEECGVDFVINKPLHVEKTLNLVEDAMVRVEG